MIGGTSNKRIPSTSTLEDMLLNKLYDKRKSERKRIMDDALLLTSRFSEDFWGKSEEYVSNFPIKLYINEREEEYTPHKAVLLVSFLLDKNANFLLLGPAGTGKTDFSKIRGGFGTVDNILNGVPDFPTSEIAVPEISENGVGKKHPILTPIGLLFISGFPITIDEIGNLNPEGRATLLTLASDRVISVYGWTISFPPYAQMYLTTNMPEELPLALVDRTLPFLFPGYTEEKLSSIAEKKPITREMLDRISWEWRENLLDANTIQVAQELSKFIVDGKLDKYAIEAYNSVVVYTKKEIKTKTLDIEELEVKNIETPMLRDRYNVVKYIMSSMIFLVNRYVWDKIGPVLGVTDPFSLDLVSSRFNYLIALIREKENKESNLDNKLLDVKEFSKLIIKEFQVGTPLVSSARLPSYINQLNYNISALYSCCDITIYPAPLIVVPAAIRKEIVVRDDLSEKIADQDYLSTLQASVNDIHQRTLAILGTDNPKPE